MRLIIATVAMAVLSTTALAQSAPPASPNDSGPAGTINPALTVKPKAGPESTGSVEPGANSFTQAQARSRFESQGLLDVRELRKDEQGIWRGTAMRNGQTVGVALDFRGTVTVQ